MTDTQMLDDHYIPSQQAESSASAPAPVHRKTGGTGTHILPAAKALIIERILCGDSNAQIDQALQAAKFLRRGQRLNPATYTEYRRSPEVKAQKNLLTDEAQQIGHAALSDAVVLHVRMMRAAGEELFAKTGNRLADVPLGKFRALYHVVQHSASFLWENLRGEQVLTEVLSQNEAEHNAMREAAAKEELFSMLKLEVREVQLKMMRQLLERKRLGEFKTGDESEQVDLAVD